MARRKRKAVDDLDQARILVTRNAAGENAIHGKTRKAQGVTRPGGKRAIKNDDIPTTGTASKMAFSQGLTTVGSRSFESGRFPYHDRMFVRRTLPSHHGPPKQPSTIGYRNLRC